jgi:NADH-quinone oxidoreductase subunit N
MLAYSSIAHAGYLMLGFVAADRFGLASVLFYSAAYLFMNMGAFYMLLLLRRDGAACENVEDFAGLARRAPVLALMMLVFLLSLTGIPLTAGFVGKFFLFGAALKQGFVWLVVVAALNTVVSLYYYMRIVLEMYFKEPDDEVEISASPSLRLALGLLLAGTLLVGLYPGPLLNFSHNCATLFLR